MSHNSSLSELKDDSLVRYLCTHCGGWREANPVKFIVSLCEGAKSGSEDAKAITEAKKKETPFMLRHIESCRAMILCIHPEDPEWSQVDPSKRES